MVSREHTGAKLGPEVQFFIQIVLVIHVFWHSNMVLFRIFQNFDHIFLSRCKWWIGHSMGRLSIWQFRWRETGLTSFLSNQSLSFKFYEPNTKLNKVTKKLKTLIRILVYNNITTMKWKFKVLSFKFQRKFQNREMIHGIKNILERRFTES